MREIDNLFVCLRDNGDVEICFRVLSRSSRCGDDDEWSIRQ